MIEKFQPSTDQIARLSEEAYEDFLAITLNRLEQVEAESPISVEEVPEDEQQTVLLSIQQSTQAALEQPTEQFLSGGSLQNLESTIAEAVSSSLLLAMLLAMGGFQKARQDPGIRENVLTTRDLIQGQFRATQRTGDRIIDGQLTPNQIRRQSARRALGVRSGFSSASIVNRMTGMFHNEGIRLLTSAHPCTDCPMHERRSWTSLDDIVPVATYCVCGANCKCKITTRFNPARALSDLASGNLLGQVSRRREMMAEAERQYLARHGWL